MPPVLTGPQLPAPSGTARQLVIFLHGYGADGNDLIGLGQEWASILPDCAFISPHAPDPCSASPMGRQWFPLTFRDPHERWRGVNEAAPVINAFIDQQMKETGLPASKIALVGFSQGTMMALHIALRRSEPLAAVIGYSGLVVLEHGKGPESLTEHITARPPLFLAHGDQDEVIPVDALFMSTDALSAAETPCQWHVSTGIGHGIDGEALRHGGLFLKQAFGIR
jgi:phospholipase/carboxylesterase